MQPVAPCLAARLAGDLYLVPFAIADWLAYL
jgi:hypothetical protein